jgi:alkanesulfonate monooxygenase SsuD/methylene tetrahydromethanopterin reductase-like flavin-dependent oxidoreductase (luciferase family)
VKIGAQFLPEDFETCLESVVAAERAGCGYAWFVDSQVLWQDVYVYMTHALERTERIVVGTAVTNPLTRHLTVTASVNALLNELHPGRVVLGLGRGDSAVRTAGERPVTTARLAESFPVLRELMAGRPVDLNDKEVSFRWHKPGPEVPIALSATGPRTLRLGGALADIVMLYVGTHPDAVGWAVGHVRAGAEEAGRDPDDVAISLLVGMEIDDDWDVARAAVKWAPAACCNHVSDTIKRNPDHDLPAVMLGLVEARNESYDYSGHLESGAEHTAYLTDELIDAFTICGPADHCLEKLRSLEALGVSEVSSAYYNGRFEQMERVGELIARLDQVTEGAAR